MIRFARALFLTNLKATAALRGAFLLQAGFMVLNNVTFFVFWWVLFDRVSEIRGWRLPDLALLFGLAATSYGLVAALAGGARFLARAIDECELDTLLTQPQPALLYAVGMRSQASGFGDVVSGIGFLWLSGHVTWGTLPLIGLGVLAGSVMLLAAGIAFFSLPFWLARTEAVSRQLWELLLTFALYPEPLFGGGLRLILYTVLPAGFVSYLPVRVVTAPSLLSILSLLAGSGAYLWLACWIFRQGLRRYSSGSRFVVLG